VLAGERSAVARAITGAEARRVACGLRRARTSRSRPPVTARCWDHRHRRIGKSSLTDELVRRFRVDQQDKLRIAVIAVDPTRRRGGGALLGDRIRMNSLDGDRIFFRSLATRGSSQLPDALSDTIEIVKAAGYDLVIVETPGIGQGDAAIVPFVDTSLYVMTPEFGAASQLEKIDMLDFADTVAINKFERRGAQDALRDVGRQLVRNREAFGSKPEDMPVFGTSAATFNDDGVTALYQHLRTSLAEHGLAVSDGTLPVVTGRHSSGIAQVVPPQRVRYLAEITETVRAYSAQTVRLADAARRVQRLEAVRDELISAGHEAGRSDRAARVCAGRAAPRRRRAHPELARRRGVLLRRRAGGDRPGPADLHRADPRVAVWHQDPPRLPASLRRCRRAGHVLAAGEPARLLPVHGRGVPVQAGRRGPGAHVRRRGDPFRTNRRFKLLSADSEPLGCRPAFDSVTLYGRDPQTRARTSTARWAPPASRWRRSTT
jgi:methylmalonyl-CoA mutase